MRQQVSWRWLLPLLVVLLAFLARTWRLDSVPPGYSDDELSNVFVISQKIFEGDTSVYYTDATGLEAPYHVVAGLMLRLFGFNFIGIRLFSAFLGTLTVPLTYQLASRLFNRRLGLLASAALALSFWSLVYSRVNLRHIALPALALAVFYCFWRGLTDKTKPPRNGGALHSVQADATQSPVFSLQFPQPSPLGPSLQSLTSSAQSPFLLSGLLLGATFYTYFAARGIPLILGAYVLFVAVVDRQRLRRRWPGVVLTFLLAVILAVPLLLTLQREASADARVSEVAVPLVQAREGNFEPLLRHVRVTLSMFHGDGDDEFLYNIPHRPVFGAPGAIFLWSGVIVAAWLALQPLWRSLARRNQGQPRQHELAGGYLLLWWAAGITPGFLSVPPASLGHTILAQPATYILLVLPLLPLTRLQTGKDRRRIALAPIVGLLLVASVAWRDLPDYFSRWSERGMVRFLYHADVEDVARFVAQRRGPQDFAISGLLAGPWDRLALRVALDNAGVEEAQPRWYDARRAVLLALAGEAAPAFSGYPLGERAYEVLYKPLGVSAGDYQLAMVRGDRRWVDESVCFRNGLCLLEATFEAQEDGEGLLHLTWGVQSELQLPDTPLYSKPPPPSVYDGPRLQVFAQRWGANGDLVSGDDGLWVDALTLEVGDVFRQQHRLSTGDDEGPGTILFGLYDPMNGQRILTEEGRDALRMELP